MGNLTIQDVAPRRAFKMAKGRFTGKIYKKSPQCKCDYQSSDILPGKQPKLHLELVEPGKWVVG
jgi:hypothetical protein